jgi:nucleotide-binding universal stress UspA family protein
MTEIRQILCPIDFSDTARHALGHAAAVARWYDARVVGLHVIPPPIVPPPSVLLSAAPETFALSEADRGMVRLRLNDWLTNVAGAEVKTEAMVDDGSAAAVILDQAERLHADLIVMGTHGLGGFERFVLGSVTERVLRKASSPVLTVPPVAETSAQLPYKRLLCPIDFSEPSLAGLRFAISLASEADARLTLLHVIDFDADGERLVDRFDVPEFRRVVGEHSRERLEELVTADLRDRCAPCTQVTCGKPYREILRVAAEEHSDLIVIGVHGRNPIVLALFGSTTNHVVRRAPCPVLTLRQ